MHPKISVIIPYYNKSYEINLQLKSLSMQTLNPNKFEVVIVDDGSNESINEILSKYDSILNLKYFKLPHTGNRGRNRNFGAQNSIAEKLVFLDADIIPELNLLEAFETHSSNEKNILLGMRNSLLPFEKDMVDDKVLEMSFDVLRNLPYEKDERNGPIIYKERFNKEHDGGWQLLYSHCFLIWKKVFMLIGGFDEEFSKDWGAEDIELGYRLYKNGFSISMCQQVQSYHIYHPVNIHQNIPSLKINYSKFLKKHPTWIVELFTREFELWTVETINLQEKIKSEIFDTKQVKDAKSIVESIPKQTVLFGITDPILVQSEKVSVVFAPNNIASQEKVKNLMGLYTDFTDKTFEFALVSNKYYKFHTGLGLLVYKEALRIARRVEFVDDAGVIKKKPLSSVPKSLIFTIANDQNFRFTKHWFTKLAIAAKNQGIICGLQYIYDPRHERDFNSGYLSYSCTPYENVINELIHHDLNIIGDQIPCIMDSECSNFTGRSLTTRILWEEFKYVNQSSDILKRKLPMYRNVFTKRAWETDYYKGTIESKELNVGVDTQLIKNILKTKNNKQSAKINFLCIERHASEISNLSILLDAFTHVFEGNEEVELTIVLPPQNCIPVFNEYCSAQVKQLYQMYTSSYNDYCRNNLNQLIHLSDTNKAHVKIIIREFNYIQMLNMIRECDCFISLNGSTEMSPLVLDAVALQRKVILLDNNCYDGYLTEQHAFRIKAFLKSAACEYHSELPRLEERNMLRYYLRYVPLVEHLQVVLNQIWEKTLSISVEDPEFMERNDINLVAEKLLNLL